MLVLGRSFRELVMAEKELDGPRQIGMLLGQRLRLAHQTRFALPECGMAPLDVMCSPERTPWYCHPKDTKPFYGVILSCTGVALASKLFPKTST